MQNQSELTFFMSQVLETRRGRCGEYSVLMMLFLDALQYDTRWVVDRDDHVRLRNALVSMPVCMYVCMHV